MAKLEQDEIKDRADFFKDFLSRSEKYQEDLVNLFAKPASSYRLELEMRDLDDMKGGTAQQLIERPSEYLPCFEVGLMNYLLSDPARFEKFAKNPQTVKIGLAGYFGRNHVTPRGLNCGLVTQMVCVEGVVTSMTGVQSRVTHSVYYNDDPKGDARALVTRQHRDNSSLIWKDQISETAAIKPDDLGNKYAQEFAFCAYKDQQRITIQEAPENAPTGQVPTSVVAMLADDMCDDVKPGDRVRVIGVYKAFPQVENGVTSAIFPMRIIANSLKKMKENVFKQELLLSETRAIKSIAQKKDFLDLLARSFAPSIAGNLAVKKGLLLLMVGGGEKNFENGTHLRGDLNVLLVGDPSCGKSQLLRFVMNLSPLAVSTTGRGSSGVGLTAAIKVDQKTGERSLEAGAMVLGDRGVVCIDEFDKMGMTDRTAIHEVMEQQTVTIAKAGVHTTLNARCSVLAAANPVYSTWDDSINLHSNIALPDSLLSRFDLIFILRDEINKAKDRHISDQVIRQLMFRKEVKMKGRDLPSVHDSMLTKDIKEDERMKVQTVKVYQENSLQANPLNKKDGAVLTTEFLRKYLEFCKETASRQDPRMTKEAGEEIGVNYGEMRQRMQNDPSPQGQLAVTTRTLEAMIRLATAHAKLRLQKEVTVEDVQATYKLFLLSRNQKDSNTLEGVADTAEDEDLEELVEEDEQKPKNERKKPRLQKKADKAGDHLLDELMGDEEEEDDLLDNAPPLKKSKKDKKAANEDEERVDPAAMAEFSTHLFNVFSTKKKFELPFDEIMDYFEEHTQNDLATVKFLLRRLHINKKIVVEGDMVYLMA